ncbi:hypothetical protein BN1232_02256 [Mycobacterium lentiflavum]|uniref:DNA-binding protein n=2 Tax=Mycobacterium lentiflavum TaxID=141349 RepID=A0A0E4CMU3_MYCLN|nr:hypothetical protein BN1232_02256 [Mycobacterium lentiflavum]
MFVLPDVTDPGDPRIDALYGAHEALVESHGGLSLASMVTPGETPIAAARMAIAHLAACGFNPERTYPDLVTRADIADRLEKRRQTVDNWVRGERKRDFPSPIHFVGGGVWLWRDVRDWVERAQVRDLPDDDGIGYPSLADHTVIDSELLRTGGFWSPVVPFVVPDAVRTLAALQLDRSKQRPRLFAHPRDYALAE